MTGLSEQQLAEIQERVLNATPGPWELYEDYGKNFYANVRGGMLLPVGSIEFGDGDTADADRALVEHAAEDIAALLAEVARLRGALSEATGYVAELEADLGGWSARVAELEAEAAKVAEFVAARAEYITAINNCHPDNAHDYHRWQGHAESRRQLAGALGLPVAWPAKSGSQS